MHVVLPTCRASTASTCSGASLRPRASRPPSPVCSIPARLDHGPGVGSAASAPEAPRERCPGPGHRSHRLRRRPAGAAAPRGGVPCACPRALGAQACGTPMGERPLRRDRRGRPGRRGGDRGGDARLCRRLLPRALDGRNRSELREGRPPARRALRGRSGSRPRRPHHLSRRPRRAGGRAERAPLVPARGGGGACGGLGARHRAPRGDDHRVRVGVVRDPALPR